MEIAKERKAYWPHNRAAVSPSFYTISPRLTSSASYKNACERSSWAVTGSTGSIARSCICSAITVSLHDQVRVGEISVHVDICIEMSELWAPWWYRWLVYKENRDPLRCVQTILLGYLTKMSDKLVCGPRVQLT